MKVGYIDNLRFVHDTNGLRPVTILDAKFLVTVLQDGSLRCKHTYWDGTRISEGWLDSWQDVVRVLNFITTRTVPFRLLVLVRIA